MRKEDIIEDRQIIGQSERAKNIRSFGLLASIGVTATGTVAMIAEVASRGNGTYAELFVTAGATILAIAGIGAGAEVAANNAEKSPED